MAERSEAKSAKNILFWFLTRSFASRFLLRFAQSFLAKLKRKINCRYSKSVSRAADKIFDEIAAKTWFEPSRYQGSPRLAHFTTNSSSTLSTCLSSFSWPKPAAWTCLPFFCRCQARNKAAKKWPNFSGSRNVPFLTLCSGRLFSAIQFISRGVQFRAAGFLCYPYNSNQREIEFCSTSCLAQISTYGAVYF